MLDQEHRTVQKMPQFAPGRSPLFLTHLLLPTHQQQPEALLNLSPHPDFSQANSLAHTPLASLGYNHLTPSLSSSEMHPPNLRRGPASTPSPTQELLQSQPGAASSTGFEKAGNLPALSLAC